MSYLVFFYGIFILIGGIMGHVRAGSAVSLAMGIVFGALLFIAAGAMHLKKRWGAPFALILIFILDAFFSYRYLTTFKLIPSGLLALVSLIVLLLLAVRMRSTTIK